MQTHRDATIFVSIASYRDSDCKMTLGNVFETAENPSRVFVGVCEQNTSEGDESCILSNEPRNGGSVRRISLHAQDARGPTYARYLCASLWQGEDYFLQLDSHMRLVPGWDDKLIRMEQAAVRQSGNSKVALSTYAGTIETYDSYLSGDASTVGTSPRLCQAFFNEQGMLSLHGANILPNTRDLVEVPFVAGGLLFCRARDFFNLVPLDPYLDDLFVGEEILLSARMWTSGFDIFAPNENIAFHKFTREGEPKFWENDRDDGDATARVRHILGLPQTGGKPGKRAMRRIDRYGLGKARTIQDYWKFAGINVADSTVSKNFCGSSQNGNDGRSQKRKTVAALAFLIAAIALAFAVLLWLLL